MTKERRNALVWILLACGISIWWGYSVGQNAHGWVDFKAVYYGTRCLLEHHNPYDVSQLDRVFLSESREPSSQALMDHVGVTLYVNVPTTFIIITPLAMLPWLPALVLWMTLTAGAFILAALLMGKLAAKYSPQLSLLLTCFLLANCECFFASGNTAGIVVSLCVVAVWCLIEERFVYAGILCLVVSLAIKPHDAGLVWLYFLLAGGVHRKRALQTLFIVAVLGLSAVLWVSLVAPHWVQDWQANLAAIASHGGLNDPSLNSVNGRTGGMVIDLQSAISVFRDDPRIYNPASYIVCGALLLVWAVSTLRSRFSQSRAWLALAVIVPLTMLVTYHRPWDAKLLMLTIPACGLLWTEGGAIARIALLLNGAAIVMTADLPLTLLTIFTRNMQLSAEGVPGQILIVLLRRPVPLILLAMSIFYLWIYVRRDPEKGMP
jgi:hypothetical protein